eukprot:COSAG04_NODE_1934_length_5182_cov_25.084349_9_plen_121_part_00
MGAERRCAHSIQQSESVFVALGPQSRKHGCPLVSTALWRNPLTQEAFIVLTTFLMRQLQPPAMGPGLASQSPPASVEYPATQRKDISWGHSGGRRVERTIAAQELAGVVLPGAPGLARVR